MFVCVVLGLTLLGGGGGDSWLAEAVLLSLGELRRRLGRVLPWSQLQAGRDNMTVQQPILRRQFSKKGKKTVLGTSSLINIRIRTTLMDKKLSSPV